MKIENFSLQPFPSLNSPANLKIIGQITRKDNLLNLDYQLLGNLEEIEITSPSLTPTRKHELWQQTCFEFFLGVTNSSSYWEFNLSPSGDWNIYRFTNYRQGMEEEKSITSLPFIVKHQPDCLSLSLKLDLGAIIPVNQGLEVAITTVVKYNNSQITYWALNHPGKEADFHRRDSFLITL